MILTLVLQMLPVLTGCDAGDPEDTDNLGPEPYYVLEAVSGNHALPVTIFERRSTTECIRSEIQNGSIKFESRPDTFRLFLSATLTDCFRSGQRLNTDGPSISGTWSVSAEEIRFRGATVTRPLGLDGPLAWPDMRGRLPLNGNSLYLSVPVSSDSSEFPFFAVEPTGSVLELQFSVRELPPPCVLFC